MSNWGSYLLVLIFHGYVSSLWSLKLVVDNRPHVGRDVPTCINQGTEKPCSTLQYVSEQLSEAGIDSNISITVRSRLSHGLVMFENISDLKINGSGIKKIMNRTHCLSPKGLLFTNITNLHFSNLHIRECGIKQGADHTVAMVIKKSTNVTIENVKFEQCRETALLLADNQGNVNITGVVFHHNRLFSSQNQVSAHSGGMEIVFSGFGKHVTSSYLIQECKFTNNTAPSEFSSFDTTLHQNSEWRGHSTGGGLGVYFKGNSSGNVVSISDCRFQDNFANWGAGMHVIFQNQALDNALEVVGSKYVQNIANEAGGGVCIRYLVSDSNVMDHYNRVTFRDVEFTANHAAFGAGTSLLSVHSSSPSTCKATFDNCTWTRNSADYAAAVNIAPTLFQRLEDGHLPVPEFIHGTFVGNDLFFSHKIKQHSDFPNYYIKFAGIFVITKSKVFFSGKTKFADNTDSALYINSGRITFKEGSVVTFVNNFASRGGAIAAYGYTSLVFSKNSLINFTQNHASELGAGIYYQPFDQHDFKTGRECFIKVSEDDVFGNSDQTNITVLFEGNTAEVAGSAVYASTLYPCFFSNDHRLANRNNRLDSTVLDFIGDVQYDNTSTALATNGREFKIEDLPPLFRFIPGKLTKISVHPVDEFDQSSKNRLALLVKFENGSMRADRKYTIKGMLRFFGRPGTNDILNIIQVAPRYTILRVNVTMLNCPPGFYFDSKDAVCKCSAFTEQHHYYGIIKCNTEEYTAYLLRGFWIGYVPSTMQQPENLYTAICPLGFCKLNSLPNYTSELPNASSELSEHVCGMHREGIVCGRCSKGYSPFFHSEGFECGPDKLCSVGIVFYILSELIPVVIIFTVVITFDFSFTSGNINGFIFFSQILELLSVNVKTYDKHSNRLLIITRVFYDLFNFDYFSTSELSFCLWKKATVIDILAFKYVTVTFALGLVVFLIALMKCCKCTKVEKLLKIKERVSVINGLSAFLVICYAQCAKTSFYILTPMLLRTQGGKAGQMVTLFGGLPFLEGRHLFYAIVAILFILTIVIIPPLVLFLYPLAACFVQTQRALVG